MVNDIKLRSPIEEQFSVSALVDSGTTAQFNPGEPSKGDDAAAASWTGEVSIMVDGDGTTSQRFTGISKSASTETASAAGEVELWLPLPGLIYSAKAKTASTADTAAEIKALFGKRVVFDLTNSVWSIDAGATDAVANCVVIVGGDHQTQTLFFVYRPSGTFMNFTISA